MNLIDLHVHSTASDGTLSPSEVVNLAIEKKLKAIALTDHDTVSGIAEALETAKEKDIEVIASIEISCYYKNTELHLLGFYVDYKNLEFLNALKELQNTRENRNRKMVEKLQADGFDISMEKLREDNPYTVITRAHFARFLYEHGYVKDRKTAFDKYIGSGCPYYLPKPKITSEYALALIKNAGGIAILAHPLLYKLGYQEIEDLIVHLKPYGLDGIEVYHSTNNQHESGKLKDIAIAHELLMTGGSDFHGDNKPDITLGSGRGKLRVNYHLLEALKNYYRE